MQCLPSPSCRSPRLHLSASTHTLHCHRVKRTCFVLPRLPASKYHVAPSRSWVPLRTTPSPDWINAGSCLPRRVQRKLALIYSTFASVSHRISSVAPPHPTLLSRHWQVEHAMPAMVAPSRNFPIEYMEVGVVPPLPSNAGFNRTSTPAF